ncbi:hypothetical protein [Nocardia sp. NBC_01329]|uniref:hypothetical protein n=1 Tax=Nocardia sp. NBC_01329 TaxID=2903594 RepID=UPI002E105B4A|nr:hypothetical protein OG405_26525 [Nocardia sp. NBC_01329]
MRKDHSYRVLRVGAWQYLWRTYHQHVDGCTEVLRLRQLGSVAGLTLVFRSDGERNVPDGGYSSAGEIWIGDRFLNLNKPGVVRAFVDGAVRRGWMAEVRTVGRRDGWDLFDEVHAAKGENTIVNPLSS